jgi:hypothetical protein
MRIAKAFSWISGFHLWIMVFAVGLVLMLGASISGSSGDGASSESNNIEEYQLPKRIPLKGKSYPPVLAYHICGTKGDSKKMLRLLKAIYHPRNQYLLQLDAASSDNERGEIAISVESQDVFRSFGNVNVVGKSNVVNRMGSSALAATLHAAALLLKMSTHWDWFITLSASDYPLVTQDGTYHFFSFPLIKCCHFILPSINIYISHHGFKLSRMQISSMLSVCCQGISILFITQTRRAGFGKSKV